MKEGGGGEKKKNQSLLIKRSWKGESQLTLHRRKRKKEKSAGVLYFPHETWLLFATRNKRREAWHRK